MKIELKYEDKNYYQPSFKFMWNNECDNFGIVIKFNDKRSYDFVIEDLRENFEKHEVKGGTFYYYTKENVYAFDLSKNYNLIPKQKDFKHCVVLLGKDNQIIERTYKQFTSMLLR